MQEVDVDRTESFAAVCYPWPVMAQNRSLETILNDIHRRIQTIAIDQEIIARSREEILAKRGYRRVLVENVRIKRVEASDAEAAFMSYVRKVATDGLHDTSGQEQTTALFSLHERVETARDKVGELENDLLQFSRSLTAAEIRFQEEETFFYQYEITERLMDDLYTTEAQGAADFVPPTTALRPPPPPLPPPPPHPPPPKPVHIDGEVHCPQPLSLPPLNSTHTEQLDQTARIKGLSHLSPLQPAPSIERHGNSDGEKRRQRYNSADLDAMGRQFDNGNCPEEISTKEDNALGSSGTSSPRASSPQYFTASAPSTLQTIRSKGLSNIETETTEVEDASRGITLTSRGKMLSCPVHYRGSSLSTHNLSHMSIDESTKTTVKRRIRAWIKDMLYQSKVEKKLYQNILEDTCKAHDYERPKNESWEDSVEATWSNDSRDSLRADMLRSGAGSLDSDSSLQQNSRYAVSASSQRRGLTNLPMESLKHGLHHTTLDIPLKDDLDAPLFFSSPIGSDGSSIDDPCYFPLPPSSVSSPTGMEGTKVSLEGEERHTTSRPLSSIETPSEPRHSASVGDVGIEAQSTDYSSIPNTMVAASQSEKIEPTTRSHTKSGSDFTPWCIQS